MRTRATFGVAVGLLLAACADARDADNAGASWESGDDTDATMDTDEGPVLDVPGGSDPGQRCHVVDDMDAPSACDHRAPPDSFDPEIQWSWTGDDGQSHALGIPLVANLTDDNGDGSVDLCDVPDIVVVANGGGWGFPPGNIYVLSGDDGHAHVRIPTAVDSWVTPALGDIDDDGAIEIVSVTLDGRFVAFAADGSLEWTSEPLWESPWGGAIALADIDGDGTSEILADNLVVSHAGELEWSVAGQAFAISATTAANLDGRPGLEVVMNSGAYHSDGSVWFELAEAHGAFAQIANLDGDAEPEILYTGQLGISAYEHDGTPIYEGLKPTGSNMIGGEFQRPAAIHDFDGDGYPEFATGSALDYAVHRSDATVVWRATVEDYSGLAGGTAFDFLGDGSAEALYGDEINTYVFSGTGDKLITVPRVSGTLIEYPVVADIDNDGSAEIIVINGLSGTPPNPRPTLEVIRDVDDRWVGARRIWNQHTYHVTNVREDGTIPREETPSWKHLNTFRTNAQAQDGGICIPAPAG